MLLDVLYSRSFDLPTLIISVVSSLIVIFLCLPIHEFAHALIADKLGDRTARYQGRLTINPFAHIDYIGALMILLVGFGYAKPVPVNQFNLRRPKRDMALIALAGPVANIIMAFIMLLLCNIVLFVGTFINSVAVLNVLAIVASVFYYAALIDVSLAVFNLIPVPPLDGSRILFSVLPDRIYYTVQQYEQYLIFAVFALIFAGVLDTPLSYATNGVLSALETVADLPFRIFGLF